MDDLQVILSKNGFTDIDTKSLSISFLTIFRNFISPAKIKEAADVVDGCLIESGYLEKNGD